MQILQKGIAKMNCWLNNTEKILIINIFTSFIKQNANHLLLLAF